MTSIETRDTIRRIISGEISVNVFNEALKDKRISQDEIARYVNEQWMDDIEDMVSDLTDDLMVAQALLHSRLINFVRFNTAE